MGDNYQPDRIEVELNAKVDQALDKTKREIEEPKRDGNRYSDLPALEIVKRIERACREITSILPLVNPTDTIAPIAPSALPAAPLPQDGRLMQGAKELLKTGVEVLRDLIEALVEKEE